MKEIKLRGNFTKHISTDDYMWQADSGIAEITPQTIKFILALEEWISWTKRTVEIYGMYRTKAYNASVGGIAASNHLIPTCADLCIKGVKIDANRFIKYAKKWKAICEKHKLTGEAGLYSWGIHLGIQSYSKTFTNWDSRTGFQKNNAFKI